MLGLSITAIGMRPLDDCIEIFQTLQPAMELDFFELAIGSPCPVEFAYPDVPLVLHDHCLYFRGMRRRLDPLRPKTWPIYADFIATHDVRAISLHPPLRRSVDRATLSASLMAMQQFFDRPVYLEIMPSSDYWCGCPETLLDVPLLLDVSHILIWHGGDQTATERTCDRILQTHSVGAIHLSHNDGRADKHDLIPDRLWFDDRLPSWRQKYLVTYESLPTAQSAYERRDKCRHRDPKIFSEKGLSNDRAVVNIKNVKSVPQ